MSFGRRSVLVLVAGAILCLTVMVGSVLFLPSAQAGVFDPGPLPTIAPAVTVLDSPTHPSDSSWYGSKSVGFHWEGSPVSNVVLKSWDAGVTVRDMAVEGDIAYLLLVSGTASAFVPLDVSDPASPVVLSTYDPYATHFDRIALQGHYACVVGSYTENLSTHEFVGVIDVSDPAEPRFVTKVNLLADHWGALHIEGSYAYVTSDLYVSGVWQTWLDIVSFSNLDEPVYVGGCQLPGLVGYQQTREMVFKDDFLYIPNGNYQVSDEIDNITGQLTVVNVTDPASPSVVATLAQDAVQPSIDGSLLFGFNYEDDQGAVNVFDIADPASVHLEGKLLAFHDWITAGDCAVQAMASSDPSLSKSYLFASIELCDPGTGGYWKYFTEIFDTTQPLALDPPSKARVLGGVGPNETDLPSDRPLCSRFTNSSLFMGYENSGLCISHIGPDAYSYVFDQNAGTVPDTTPVGTQSGLGADLTVTAPADGTYYFHVRAEDHSGTWSTTVTRKVQIDSTVPTVTSNADGQAHQVFTLAFTGSDPGGSGVAHTYYRPVIAGVTTGYVEKSSVTLRVGIRHKRPGLARGTYTFQYYCTDAAGNRSTTGSCQVTIG